MRFVLSTLLGLTLGLPAMAQPDRGGFPGGGGPGGPGGRGEQPSKEVEELKATIKALEAKLKATGERKVEVVVREEKKPEVKKDEKGDKKDEKGDKKDEKGDKKDEKGDKKDEKGDTKEERGEQGEKGDKKPEPKKPEEARGPQGPGGGFGGGQGGFGGGPGGFGGGFSTRGFGGGQPGTPPGFDKLTKDEQAMFRKLMEKMGDPREVVVREVPRVREVVREVLSMEERMEKLERAIEEIRRGMQGPRGGGR